MRYNADLWLSAFCSSGDSVLLAVTITNVINTWIKNIKPLLQKADFGVIDLNLEVLT
jgi:hypothetical protein